MFCPDCGREFDDDFDYCLHCKTLLVPTQPQKPVPENLEYVEVPLPTWNQVDFAFFKSMLEDGEVLYFLQGERAYKGYPRLLVRKEDVEQTIEIIKYMEQLNAEEDEEEETEE